jgi:hypothetical protein
VWLGVDQKICIGCESLYEQLTTLDHVVHGSNTKLHTFKIYYITCSKILLIVLDSIINMIYLEKWDHEGGGSHLFVDEHSISVHTHRSKYTCHESKLFAISFETILSFCITSMLARTP